MPEVIMVSGIVMVKKMLVLLCMFWATISFAQEDAWVYFKDKPDSQYYLSNPTEMLSQKALERRSKQGIEPDEKDVPLHQPYVEGIVASDGITVMAKSKWLNALHIRGSREAIDALKALDFVQRVDFADRTLNADSRTDRVQNQYFSKTFQDKANLSYGNAARQIEMLNGHLLHQNEFTGSGINIAVLDAGFPGVDTTEPFRRLRDNDQIKGGYNYVSGSDNFYSGGNHGTIVLSTMGAFIEGQFAGTAPDASYYLFVTEDVSGENPVEESYWVEAAEAADSLGVDVINTSLGYFGYQDARYSHIFEDMDGNTAFITRGANIAISRGIFCVVSAGNTGNTTLPNMGAPADAYNMLTVGAVDSNKNYAGFSSRGPTADGRIKPDVAAMGYLAAIANQDGEITATSGTSLSSPVVAGLVACLWQALPDKTNAELLQIIKESADLYVAPTTQLGYGIPDFNLAMEKGMGLTDNKIVLYPNPSADIINVLLSKKLTATNITVYNMIGQKVMEQEVSVSNPYFSVSLLSEGVYNCTFEGTSQTIRIIKI